MRDKTNDVKRAAEKSASRIISKVEPGRVKIEMG